MELYRDNGLLILPGANGQKTDKTRKNIIEIFKNIGFKIDIETNLKEVNFLNVTFNLVNETFRPYKNPMTNCCIFTPHLTILHKFSSNFPTSAVNERLSHNSSDEVAFNSTKFKYEDALKKSGYEVNLKYTAKTTAKTKKNRQRNIIWFNPSFNKSVKTNVAKIFFLTHINCTKSLVVKQLK